MLLEQLCPPALLFVAFTLTQVIIDILRSAYDTAMVKAIVGVVFTLVLNALCSAGLGIVSWMIVFIPFIMMTLITALILAMLGMAPDVDVRKQQRPKRWEREWWRRVKRSERIDARQKEGEVVSKDRKMISNLKRRVARLEKRRRH